MPHRLEAAPTPPTRPVRVALVNDYQIVVEGLKSLLEPYADRVEVVELLVNMSPTKRVDLALYDTFAAPVGDQAEVDWLLADPDVDRVAIYSFSTEPELVDGAFDCGAAGFVSKTLDGPALVDAIERLAAGEQVVEKGQPGVQIAAAWPGAGAGLSVREAEIIGLITQGLSNQDIAQRCFLSINTIKTYIRTAYRKIGVQTRAQAVAWGMMNGMRPDEHRTAS